MNYKHGLYGTKFYIIWRNLRPRCRTLYYKNNGIKCLWNSFEEFKKDMFKSYLKHVERFGQKNTTLDRINSTGNYQKSNCRWATHVVQCRNRKTNIFYTYKGKSRTINEWADIYKINKSTFRDRLRKHNWSFKEAVSNPVENI